MEKWELPGWNVLVDSKEGRTMKAGDDLQGDDRNSEAQCTGLRNQIQIKKSTNKYQRISYFLVLSSTLLRNNTMRSFKHERYSNGHF